MQRLCGPVLLFIGLSVPSSLVAGQVVIDFEGFPDSTILTNQYPGVTFTNAIVLTVGISLNEFEFPPDSGVNVASDNGGAMTLTFASTITSFGAYFTYAEPLTLDALNAMNAVVASAGSLFSNNEALSGDPGSSPNEFIQVSFVGGISSVTITGDPLGGSFAMDNATYTTAGGTMPEPSSLSLCLLGIGLAVGYCLAVRWRRPILGGGLASVSRRLNSRLSFLIGCLLSLALFAAPTVAAATSHSLGLVAVSPTTAVIGTPTQVTVTASITDPALISNSVNLLRLNTDGTTTILGTLHDDGLNGDEFAGDLDFTLVVTINASAATQIQLQVSAAFTGTLLRVKSAVMSVFFQPANAPQQALTALAHDLASGNRAAAFNYINPSINSSTIINTYSQQALNSLASSLKAAVLVGSSADSRIFQSPFTAPDGTTALQEFDMVPGVNGQWLINSW